jgi:hypothetical protein
MGIEIREDRMPGCAPSTRADHDHVWNGGNRPSGGGELWYGCEGIGEVVPSAYRGKNRGMCAAGVRLRWPAQA